MTDGVASSQGDGDEGVGKAATEPSAPWRLWRLHGNRLNGWQYVLDPSLRRAHLNGGHGIPPTSRECVTIDHEIISYNGRGGAVQTGRQIGKATKGAEPRGQACEPVSSVLRRW